MHSCLQLVNALLVLSLGQQSFGHTNHQRGRCSLMTNRNAQLGMGEVADNLHDRVKPT